MLSYHLLDHFIYCLPRVPNILDWTLRGGDALTCFFAAVRQPEHYPFLGLFLKRKCANASTETIEVSGKPKMGSPRG
jgi:hypothetical protein